MALLDPTPASRWRLALARSLAGRYARHAHVAGILAGGSTARGHADQFSDLELMVLWSEAPAEHDRRGVIAEAGGDLHAISPYDQAYAVWEDTYFMGRDAADRVKSGCLVEVSHLLVPTLMDRIGRVLERAEADEALLNLMAGLADGRILAGAPLLRPLQDRVAAYPEALQRAVARRYGYIDHFWRWEMYLARGNNVPEVYDLFTAVLHRAVHLLLGVNRRYFGGWKWLMSMVDHRRMEARTLPTPELAPWAQIVPTARAMTVDDLLTMPDDGWQYELVEGVLVRMAGSGELATTIAMAIAIALGAFVRPRRLGRLTGADGVYRFPGAQTGLIPDVGYYGAALFGRVVDRDTPIPFAPELAVEVASPEQDAAALAAKVQRYLRGGTRLVWVVWPHGRTVDVWRPADLRPRAARMRPSATLGVGHTLDGEDVVPGFSHPIAEIFEL